MKRIPRSISHLAYLSLSSVIIAHRSTVVNLDFILLNQNCWKPREIFTNNYQRTTNLHPTSSAILNLIRTWFCEWNRWWCHGLRQAYSRVLRVYALLARYFFFFLVNDLFWSCFSPFLINYTLIHFTKGVPNARKSFFYVFVFVLNTRKSNQINDFRVILWHAWRVTMHINKGFFPVSLSSKQEVFHLGLSHRVSCEEHLFTFAWGCFPGHSRYCKNIYLFLNRSFCLTRNGFVFYRYRWSILFNVFILGSGCDGRFLCAVYFLAWGTWLFFVN